MYPPIGGGDMAMWVVCIRQFARISMVWLVPLVSSLPLLTLVGSYLPVLVTRFRVGHPCRGPPPFRIFLSGWCGVTVVSDVIVAAEPRLVV